MRGWLFVAAVGGGLLGIGALRSVDAMIVAALLVGGVCSMLAVVANIIDR